MYQPTNAKQITSAVAERLDTLKDEGLALPAHYNAQNALKAAYLRLQTVKDRQGRPALTVCTEPSIANALLDMAIQGLSPAKNQCYFIVYGNELQMQRSYFGTIAALKRLDSIDDIDAQVIHQGDEFEIGADETGAKTNRELMMTKPTKTNPDGHLRAEFKLADQMIQTLENDRLFNYVYMPGEKEVIVTGKIGDHEWKGKIDSLVLNKGYFCDLKTVDDIHKKHWDAKNHRWTNFIEDRGYIMQAAIYQELIKQSFNKNCQPFIFAVSKQTPPDKGAFDFEDTDTQYLMKEALEEIKEKQDRFWQVMNGEVEPKHCGKCEYCRSMKELAAFQHVTDIEVD